MDFMRYLLAIVLWAVFYFFVGLALAFGAKLGWESAQGILDRFKNRKPKPEVTGGAAQRTVATGRTESSQVSAETGGNGRVPSPAGQPARS